jgi:hypothetical protein
MGSNFVLLCYGLRTVKLKDFLTKEIIDGCKQWFKLFCYGMAFIWFLDIISKLPNELSKPIVDSLMDRFK